MAEKVAELKVSKSPEEIKIEAEKAKKDKEKAFYDDPDKFIHINDIMVGAVRTPETEVKGPYFIIHSVERFTYHIIMGELHHLVAMRLVKMDAENAIKNRRIVLAGQKPQLSQGGFGGR